MLMKLVSLRTTCVQEKLKLMIGFLWSNSWKQAFAALTMSERLLNVLKPGVKKEASVTVNKLNYSIESSIINDRH